MISSRRVVVDNDETCSDAGGTTDVSSNETPPRGLFAPNDPYLGTVGGQPSLPWSAL